MSTKYEIMLWVELADGEPPLTLNECWQIRDAARNGAVEPFDPKRVHIIDADIIRTCEWQPECCNSGVDNSGMCYQHRLERDSHEYSLIEKRKKEV